MRGGGRGGYCCRRCAWNRRLGPTVPGRPGPPPGPVPPPARWSTVYCKSVSITEPILYGWGKEHEVATGHMLWLHASSKAMVTCSNSVSQSCGGGGNFLGVQHRLNMEVDLQSLFGLHVTWCAQLYSWAETPKLPPPPAFGLVLRGRYWSAKIDDISL